MVILNQAKTSELTLRLVLESEIYGREYFDNYDNMTEVIEAVSALVKSASDEAALDGIERAVTVAIVPKVNYGDDNGHGFGLLRENS
jgi:hypothetical protein